MIGYFIRFTLIITLFTRSEFVASQNCPPVELYGYHHKMQELIKNYKPLAAIFYADSIMTILTQKNLLNCEKTFWIQLELGEAYELDGEFEKAIAIYQNLIKSSEQKLLWSLLTHSNLSLARCFETIGRPQDCLRHLKNAKELMENKKVDTAYATFCTRYASYHRIFGNKDSAILYAQKSVHYGRLYQIARSIMDGHLLLGILNENLDTAIYHFQQAVDIFNERGDFNGVASQLMNICSRLIKAKKFDPAQHYLDRAHQAIMKLELDSKSYYGSLSRYYSFRRHLFEKRGFIDSAYQSALKEHEFFKKAERIINQEKITANAIEFAVAREKEQNNVLEKDAKILRLGILLLSLVILVIIILLLQNKKKQKAIAEQNGVIHNQNILLEKSLHQQSLLLSEVHHRIKNNLQLIISLLNLRGHQTKSNEIKTILDEVSSKVSAISLIHEQLYSTGDFANIDLCQYITNLIHYYKIFNDEESEVICEQDIDRIQLNLETVMPIGVICSELLGNSIKYARVAGNKLAIKISVQHSNGKIFFKYSDNGPGIPEQNISNYKSNMGLVLIANMARQLQADYKIYNDHGANFNMNFVEKVVSEI